ncbi:hypothetical protein BU16DRAFT_546782 [Lophium mytilinum]|uniref:C2H2-type domain-containing protein n=1 Tax=Lophium mytilinum TaxID=390894 RepID=A0A6A6RAB2_9PEZI|nr:hypothetical protein BU16DRAFT_546782 [Lophium mytilinum]
MSNFFFPDADMPLMSEPDGYGNYYTTSVGQSTPSIIYSPPLQPAQSLPMVQPHQAQYYQQPQYAPNMSSSYPPQSLWAPQHSSTQSVPMSYSTYPQPTGTLTPTNSLSVGSSMYSNQHTGQTRASRSPSAASLGSYTRDDGTRATYSRSLSPNAPDLREYGYLNKNGTWTCAYPGCTSRAVFTRGCDLRKHHKRHTKSFFCRHEGCPQSTGGGFSSKKDLARHEAKHNPGVMCEWSGCDRVFSRVDNMRDHVKRIHLKGAQTPPQ